MSVSYLCLKCESASRGLLNDYEPSDRPFSSSILHSHRTLMTPRSASRRARRRLRSWRWSTIRWTRRPRTWSPTSGSPGPRSSPSSSGKSRPKTFTVFQPNYKFVCTLCKYNYQNYCKVQNCMRNVSSHVHNDNCTRHDVTRVVVPIYSLHQTGHRTVKIRTH